MKKAILTFFCTLSLGVLVSQQRFIKIADVEFGQNIVSIPTQDGGWTTFSTENCQLAYFDKCGNFLFGKKYQIASLKNNMPVTPLIRTSDGSFVIFAPTMRDMQAASELIKLDRNGEVMWSRTIADPGFDQEPLAVMEDRNGNLVVYGYVTDGTDNYYLLAKITSAGALLWAKHFGLGLTFGGAIITSDNGILSRSGSCYTKLDENGDFLWQCSSSVGGGHYYNPIEVSDGYIFISSGTDRLHFSKIGLDGRIIIGDNNFALKGHPRSLIKKSNGNLAGIFTREQDGVEHCALAEFDENVNLVSLRSLGDFRAQGLKFKGQDIALLTDNGILVSGQDEISGQFFFARLDADGRGACSQDLLPVPSDQGFYLPYMRDLPFLEPEITLEAGSVTASTFQVSTTTLCGDLKSLDLGPDVQICELSKTTLHSQTDQLFDRYEWSTGEESPAIEVSQPGNYWVRAIDDCIMMTVTDSVQVLVHPVVQPDLGPEKMICGEETAELRAPDCSGCVLEWSDGTTGSSLTVDEEGEYWLKVTAPNGCPAADTVAVKETMCDCEVFVPNSFTPDGDGLNEELQVQGYCEFREFHLQVFDRWGRVVFRSNDPAMAWNGNLEGNLLPTGLYQVTFSYVPLIREEAMSKVHSRSTVTLIR